MLLISILFSQFVFGNNFKEYLGDGKFLLEGKINNYPKSQNDGIINISVEGYLDLNSVDVPINKDGSFKAEIPITDIQDVSFWAGDNVSFFTFKNDTVRIEFSYDDALQTMKLSGTSENRNKDLALSFALSNYKNSNPSWEIDNIMFDSSITDSIKKEKLNQYYNEQIKIIDEFIAENHNTEFREKFVYDAYYGTCEIALSRGTSLLSAINNGYCHPTFHPTFCATYYWVNEDIFRFSPIYRNYLGSYIFTNGRPPYHFITIREHNNEAENNKAENENEPEVISNIIKQYYYALSQLDTPWIRDWYITKRFLLEFTLNELADINFVFEDFKKICRNKSYIAKLEEIYSDISTLYNADLAPNFTLKNEKGEFVSLSDFTGKIVYLDFWDLYCGPCIVEFKNYDKRFHEKYKGNDIVHIYICFSDDEKKWKGDIKKYDLQGINLISESRKKNDNKLYKDYAFVGFPHYILISRNGKVFRNGCERPSEMLMSEQNTLDKLLKIEN